MSIRAAEYLEQRIVERQSTLTTMEDRLDSSDWVNDVLALTWYRFWVNLDVGWRTWRSFLIASLTYDPSILGALIDMLRFFSPVAPTRAAKWLKEVRMITGPKSDMASDAMSVDWLGLDLESDSGEPYQGCVPEFRAMTAWVRGRLARLGHLDDAALEFWLGAAEDVPQNALELRKRLSTALGILGDSVFGSNGSIDKAQIAIERSCQLNPNSGRSWHALGHIYERKKDIRASLVAFEKARDLEPERAENWRCIGKCYLSCKEPHQAVEALRKAIDLDGTDRGLANSWYLLGRAYMSQKQFDAATEAYKEAIAHDADAATLWNNISDAYLRQDKWDEAITAAEHAIRAGGSDKQKSIAWLNLGVRT